MGLRVSLTRARYPNLPGGQEQYAVTVSRLDLDRRPTDSEGLAVLELAFGAMLADRAVERGGGPLVRLYRVPVDWQVET